MKPLEKHECRHWIMVRRGPASSTVCQDCGEQREAVLLVGESNPYTPGQHGRDYAFFPDPAGASGDRLCRILGMSRPDYLRLTSRINLCGQRWHEKTARAEARAIYEHWPAPRPIVLVGRKVQRAFGLIWPDPVFVSTIGLVQLIGIPHPSGANRSFDRETQLLARRAVLGAAPRLRESSFPESSGVSSGEKS